VAGCGGDDALRNASLSGGCRKTGPQGMTGHIAGVEPGSCGMALQHEGDRLRGETRYADTTMAVY
jgi:hypothetical protein